ncbi:MAG TPA: HDOD domain-containing protein [Gammaproteobacteria bacterium]|nr:HDOD domain-containing protein [Gammaproteobacteria bacterium]
MAQDVSFSYRILRYINSAQFSYSRKVESIQSAATMIGLQRIKIWLTILVMAQIDDKPYELLLTSLIRARACAKPWEKTPARPAAAPSPPACSRPSMRSPTNPWNVCCPACHWPMRSIRHCCYAKAR